MFSISAPSGGMKILRRAMWRGWCGFHGYDLAALKAPGPGRLIPDQPTLAVVEGFLIS